MKLLVALTIFIATLPGAFAMGCGGQHETGFYAQTMVKASHTAYWYGVQAGAMLNEHVGLGGAFNSLAEHHVRPHRHLDTDYDWYGDQLAVAYAGVVLSYSGRIGKGWHGGVSLLVGDGWKGWEHSSPDYYGNWNAPPRVRFLALEPTFHLEGNVTSRFRVTGGLGYLRADRHGVPDYISSTMYSVGLKYLTR